MTPFNQRLAQQYDDFSLQEKRIADYILHHYDDLISYNSAELAKLVGVSKSTVSRFFKKLGYESYRSVRDELRLLRQTGLPITDQRNATIQGDSLVTKHYKQEVANLNYWTSQLDDAQFARIIAHLKTAKRIFVIGLRNSYAVALHLRQQLLQIRSDVYLLPQVAQTLAEELVDLTAKDLVIIVAFRRRPAIIHTLLQQLKQQQIATLLFTEPNAHGLTLLATYTLVTPLDSVSAFDSYSSAMSVINLLSNALLHENLASGRKRIYQVADLYSALDELELSRK